MNICMYIQMYVRTHMCVSYASIYPLHIYIYIPSYIYICRTYIYMNICVCEYIYIYMQNHMEATTFVNSIHSDINFKFTFPYSSKQILTKDMIVTF